MFYADDAEAMAEAGADIVVCHLGLTTGGSIGAETALKLADCPALVDAWAEAALEVNPDVHRARPRRPGREPEDAAFMLQNTAQLPRLLRRLLDGAAADRGRADRADDDGFKAISLRDPPRRT